MSNFIGGLIQFVFRIERRAEKIYGYFQQDSFFPIGIFAFFICCLAWKPRKCTPARKHTVRKSLVICRECKNSIIIFQHFKCFFELGVLLSFCHLLLIFWKNTILPFSTPPHYSLFFGLPNKSSHEIFMD